MELQEYAVWVCAIIYYIGIVTGFYSHHPSPEWYNPDAIIHSFLFMALPLKLSQWWRKRQSAAPKEKGRA